MSKIEKNKFYWVEGVTRDEVIRSLEDHRPTRLRDQRVRRWLVGINCVLITLLAGSNLITGNKLRSYLEAAGFAALLYLYLTLRKSIRHISDAPNELLDERLIEIRNAAYLVAYRYLGSITIPLFWFGYVTSRDVEGLMGSWTGIFITYLMFAAGLPAMVLAWTLPTERHEVG